MLLRLTIGLLGLLPGILLAQGQSPVDITAEPHHHLIFENDKVRVFTVTLEPHQATSLTRHPNNFLVITPDTSEVASWAEHESGVITYHYDKNDIRFFFGGKAEALRNDTATEYHNLTIEFLDPKVTTYGYQAGSGRWQYGSNTLPAPVDPNAKFANVMPLGIVKVKDVQLLPNDAYPAPETDASEMIVALSDIELKNGDDQRIRKSRGELAWIGPTRETKLMNHGEDAARFVLVEFREEPQK